MSSFIVNIKCTWLGSKQKSLFYVFVLVYGNLCTFVVSEHIVFLDNEMIIQWKTQKSIAIEY